jgi:hypothetical protein
MSSTMPSKKSKRFPSLMTCHIRNEIKNRGLRSRRRIVFFACEAFPYRLFQMKLAQAADDVGHHEFTAFPRRLVTHAG